MEPSFQLSNSEIDSLQTSSIVNVNIGILGHVDSGKTSLVKALTKIPSTASLDKNPQSQQRGITLDLGFSCLMVKSNKIPAGKVLQITLVDCPGHASLIRTIIGGASIIDMMILVIDVNKGIQTQTAECLVIGELLIPKLIVVLNKIDLLPKEERNSIIQKKMTALVKIFQKTKFANTLTMIPLSANVGGQENQKINESLGVEALIELLIKEIEIPIRNQINENLLFLIDHCFPMKGQGSVVTGTVIKGAVKIGDEVEFPQIKDKKKVKSMQMFHKNVEKAVQGDRIGMLFTNLDSKLIERGVACEPGTLKPTEVIVMNIKKINYFKQSVKSKAKFHITIDHQTVMGSLLLFEGNSQEKVNLIVEKFNFDEEFNYLEELPSENEMKKPCFAMIKLEKPLVVGIGGLIIGARFDSDINDNSCRLAFHGNILWIQQKKGLEYEGIPIKIYKEKSRTGIVEKIVDNHTLLIRNLFKKETNISVFVGKKIKVCGFLGKILGGFGQSGKVKAGFDEDLLEVKGEEMKESDVKEKFLKGVVVMSYKKYLKIEKY